MTNEYITIKTTENVKLLLRNLKDETGEAMYKIQERLLLKEYEERGIKLPENYSKQQERDQQ